MNTTPKAALKNQGLESDQKPNDSNLMNEKNSLKKSVLVEDDANDNLNEDTIGEEKESKKTDN